MLPPLPITYSSQSLYSEIVKKVMFRLGDFLEILMIGVTNSFRKPGLWSKLGQKWSKKLISSP